MKERQITHAEEFKITYVDTLSSRRGSITQSFSDFLPKSTVWKAGESHFTVEIPDKYYVKPDDQD